MPAPGHVFWLFGLSGAGKSTLATQPAAQLHQCATPSLVLDGDTLRAGLCHGLGFSDAERAETLRRAAEVARLGLASGLVPQMTGVSSHFETPAEFDLQIDTSVEDIETSSARLGGFARTRLPAKG